MKSLSLTEEKNERSKIEDEGKNTMKERDKLRIWDLAWKKPNEGSDLGRLKSDCDMDEWQIEDQPSRFQTGGAKDTEHCGQD